MPLDRLIEFLVHIGRNLFDDPESVASSLRKAARSSYRLPDSMSSTIRVIRVVQEQLKVLKKATQTNWEQ